MRSNLLTVCRSEYLARVLRVLRFRQQPLRCQPPWIDFGRATAMSIRNGVERGALDKKQGVLDSDSRGFGGRIRYNGFGAVTHHAK
jgi:hypothetical protein